MIGRRPFNKLAAADHSWLKARHHFSFRDYWDAKRVRGAMMTFLAIALRGVLITITVVAIAFYLLLTNSHL